MNKKYRGGFTIVELAVSIAIASAVAIGLVAILGNLLTTSISTSHKTKRTGEIHQAIRTIQNDTMIATEFQRSTDQDGFSGWHATGNISGASPNQRSLILKIPATSSNYRSPTRRAVYYNPSDPTDTSCPADQSRSVVTIMVQYYIQNDTLYRRTLVPTPLPALCNGETLSQVQTNSTKPNQDIKVAENISEFTIEYYTDNELSSTEPTAYNEDTAPLEGISLARLHITSEYEMHGKTDSINATSLLKLER